LRRLRDASELELPQPVDQWFEPLKIWSTILQVVDSRRLKIPTQTGVRTAAAVAAARLAQR